MQKLRVVRETSHWITIDKPAGFHTHPPEDKRIRMNPRWNALGILERQFSQKLFPLHRLDRAASGLLIYSRDRAVNSALQEQFSHGAVEKTYVVLARGGVREELWLREPLKSESGALLPAETRAIPAHTFTLPIPHPRGGMREFTLLQVATGTGRFHQIRRHFAQAGLPLVGDSRHGDRKLNRQFQELTGCGQLFLRCMALRFACPSSGEEISLRGRWSREWHRLFDLGGACPLVEAKASPFREPKSLS